MSDKIDYSVHPRNPAAQPFQGRGTPNRTKKNSWWNVNSGNYWRNRRPKKQATEEQSLPERVVTSFEITEMPIYLYKCSRCKETVEKIQPVDSTPPSTCEHCNAHGTMEKQISAPASFILKGTGWYKTDFR